MRAGWTISAWFLSLIWSIEHDGLRNVPDGPFLGGGPALVRPACAGARNHRQGRRRLTAPPAPWRRRRRPRWPARPTCFAFSRLASRWNCGVHFAHYSSGQALRGLPYSFLDDEVYVWAALWATRPVTRAALVPLAIAAYLWRRMPPPSRHSPGASSRWPPPPRGWIPATRCWAWGVRGPGTPCSCLIDSQKARVMDELSKPKSSAMALTTCFVESPVLMVADVGSIAVPCDQGDAYSTMSYIRALTSNGATARCEASFPVPACLSSKRETPARLSQAGVSWATGNGSCCGSAPCCRWCFGIYLHAAAANR